MDEEFDTYDYKPEIIRIYLNTLINIEKKIEYMIWLKSKYDFEKRILRLTFTQSFVEAGYWIENEYEHLIEMQKTEINSTLKKKKTEPNDKIIWNRSRQSLEGLFNSLHKDGYISKYAQENIYEHIIIRSTESQLSKNKQLKEKKISKIRWLKRETRLVFLMDYLLTEGVITIKGDRIHKMTFYHFCKRDNSDYNTHNLSQTLINLHALEGGKKNAYPEFKNLIDSSINPPPKKKLLNKGSLY